LQVSWEGDLSSGGSWGGNAARHVDFDTLVQSIGRRLDELAAWLHKGPKLVRLLRTQRREIRLLQDTLRAQAEKTRRVKHDAKQSYARLKAKLAIDHLAGQNLRLSDELTQATTELAAQARRSRDEQAVAFRERKQLRRTLVATETDLGGLIGRLNDAGKSVGAFADAFLADGADPVALLDLADAFLAHGDLRRAAACYRSVGPDWFGAIKQRLGRETVYRPDFLIIGAPRAGTGWLRKTLSWCPQVCILRREQGYFARPHVPLASYLARFGQSSELLGEPDPSLARSDGRTLFGEKSPGYLGMPDDNIALCATLFPDLRIICSVRNPVDRAWSEIKHHRAHRFADDLATLRALPGARALDGIIDRSRYEFHLSRWARRFAPDQIHLVSFEDIVRDPHAVQAAILAHIGAASCKSSRRPLERRSNASESLEPPPRLVRHLKQALAQGAWDVPALRAAMERSHADRQAEIRQAGSLQYA
jgi:hypothetical protein